jgi:hypothetical protein
MGKPLYRTAVAFFVAVMLLFWTHNLLGQEPGKNSIQSEKRKYTGKSQIFSLKGQILGGEFRISNVIPLQGDFSKYQRIEASRLRSLVGDDIPPSVLESYGKRLLGQFQDGGRFGKVSMIDDYHPPLAQAPADPNQGETAGSGLRRAETPEDVDPLDGPMLGWDDMRRFDELRAKNLETERTDKEKPPPTLVIVGEVLDYAKGNKWLQQLPLNRGNAVFTIRFRYYDKETGHEVGRQVIGGEVTAANLGGAFGLRTALSGVVDGVVDQITRRAVSAEW